MKFTQYLCGLYLFLILLNLSASYKIKNKNFLSSDDPKAASNSTSNSTSNEIKALSVSYLFAFTETITLNIFLDKLKFSLYKISKGEAIQIFNFIDREHKGIISPKDWKDFANLFLKPFDKCDTKKAYFLEKADLQKCFENEPTSKFIIPPKELKDKFYDILIDILDINNNLGKKINFYSYLLLRKAMFSWSECHNDGSSMTTNSFKCAISYVSGSYIDKYNLENMHLAAMMENGMPKMDFISFLRVFTILHMYEVLGARKDKFRLDKDTFEKSLKEDTIIDFISQGDIDRIYSFSDSEISPSINFETFYFFINIFKLYNIHAKDKSGITIEEAASSVDHLLFPNKLRKLIDLSLTNFKAADYLKIVEEDKSRQGEKKYYVSFLEKSLIQMKENINSTESRKVFFSMLLRNKDPKKLSKTEYSMAFVYASLFETMYSMGGKSRQEGCINIEYIIKNIDNAYTENILKFNEKTKFASQILRKMPLNLNIDVLLFNSIESLNPYFFNNFQGLSADQTFKENYGIKEIPEEKLVTAFNTAEEKFQTLLNIFSIQAKVAVAKRNEKQGGKSGEAPKVEAKK